MVFGRYLRKADIYYLRLTDVFVNDIYRKGVNMSPRKSLSPEKRVGYTGKPIPNFCKNVARRRIELGLTQEELASLIGAKGPRISEIEAGSLPRDEQRIINLAIALKVDINWLFGFTTGTPDPE